MKIRTMILLMLILVTLVSTGSLSAFAAAGETQIKGVTSEASSEELLDSANNELMEIAIGIRDSLDNQMQNQYDMVKTWAASPILLETAADARYISMTNLYEMWSETAGREYIDSEAVGDGDITNDLSPTASAYLQTLAEKTMFTEIFITDSRGYVVAANTATSDFDQGPDDWRVFLEDGAPKYIKHNPTEGGEDWYRIANESADGSYISEVEWDDSSATWGIEIVYTLKDTETDAYLGQLKAVFDYGSFVNRLFNTDELGIYEAKVVDSAGIIVATSMEDKTKVNNTDVSLADANYFNDITSGVTTGYTVDVDSDENGSEVFIGYAVSNDANKHVVVVSRKVETVLAPIEAFTSGLVSSIGDKSMEVQRRMWINGAVVAILIVLAASYFIKRKISNPLSKLTDVSKRLSRGEIEGLELDVRGKDEIGQLGENFGGVFAAFNLLKEQVEESETTRTKERV